MGNDIASLFGAKDPGPPITTNDRGEPVLVPPPEMTENAMFDELSEDEDAALPDGWKGSTNSVPSRAPFLRRSGRTRPYFYDESVEHPIPTWLDPRTIPGNVVQTPMPPALENIQRPDSSKESWKFTPFLAGHSEASRWGPSIWSRS